MHELSLAQGLLDQLLVLARKHQAKRITKVTVEIGPFSAVVVDSFRFGFEILRTEYSLTSETELEIIEPNAKYKCQKCGFETATRNLTDYSCPACSTGLMCPQGGDELTLISIEIE